MNRNTSSEWAISILADVEKFLAMNGMHDSAAVVFTAAATLRRQTISDLNDSALNIEMPQAASASNVIKLGVAPRNS